MTVSVRLADGGGVLAVEYHVNALVWGRWCGDYDDRAKACGQVLFKSCFRVLIAAPFIGKGLVVAKPRALVSHV
jgi:hypothetical protein